MDSPAVRLLERTVDWIDAESAFLALFGDAPNVVWLDDALGVDISLMGAPTDVRIAASEDAIAMLTTLLAAMPRTDRTCPLGWIGWMSYEAAAAAVGTEHYPDGDLALAVGWLDRAVIVDSPYRQVRIIALDTGPEASEWVRSTADSLREACPAGQPREPVRPSHSIATWRHSRDAYLAMINESQRRIREGEVYLVCLCNEASVPGRFDPLEVYRRLRRLSPTSTSRYIRFGETALACGSPERFIEVDPDGRMWTRPIKGTRPRYTDPVLDEGAAHELASSEKERAENLMIVDLMRNDVARVAELGSVRVPELFAVESFATVHQLVSTVEAHVDPDRIAELIRVVVPPGSMTGAPKRAAMVTINDLERGPRGVFSGVAGRFSVDGSVDLAVVIRSVVVTAAGATIGAGGGITALSDPDEEWDEVMLKARAMFAALGVEIL